ncbi:MAG: NAD(P)H-dependent glycerol-3-phosphate dehydrogenase [Patescibacteria group bacterium]|nr:NAD(P)H-dependent glycerol-3-phosphate dehydrogenase [Patescibacteria group bacterium]
MRKTNIAILGAGNVGTSLAYHLGKKGHPVYMYCIEPDVEKQINKKHCNKKYLKKVKLPHNVKADSNIQTCLKDAHLIIMAVPSHVAISLIQQAKPFLQKNATVACITKGLNSETLEPVVISIKKHLPKDIQKHTCMIGGPAIATELTHETPTAFVVASTDKNSREFVAGLLRGGHVKVAESTDLMGVGLGAALKNPYAISIGFCDGLHYPTNSKALIITMAVSEMAGIMLRAGADPKTAPSLAGLGDLLVTGLSPHGHNRTYGEKLIKAKTNDHLKLGLSTVEGIRASELCLKLARRLQARTPLLEAIYRGIHSNSNYHKPFEDYLNKLKLDLI